MTFHQLADKAATLFLIASIGFLAFTLGAVIATHFLTAGWACPTPAC